MCSKAFISCQPGVEIPIQLRPGICFSKFPEDFFQIHFILIGGNSSYKLAQGVSWPCKVFNGLALKVINNRLSGNKHCTRKIVFRN